LAHSTLHFTLHLQLHQGLHLQARARIFDTLHARAAALEKGSRQCLAGTRPDTMPKDILSLSWRSMSVEDDVLTSPVPCCGVEVRVPVSQLDALGQANVHCPADGRRWLLFYVPWVRTHEAGWIG
jgi:hypothetical protein